MSAVLLCGNTVKAHAQADLTPEESQKLTEFLATQPTNGARGQYLIIDDGVCESRGNKVWNIWWCYL